MQARTRLAPLRPGSTLQLSAAPALDRTRAWRPPRRLRYESRRLAPGVVRSMPTCNEAIAVTAKLNRCRATLARGGQSG